MRVVYILSCLLLSLAGAYFGQPLARGNMTVVNIMITVITVFAGFLVAIIAVLGDPAMLPRGSWRAAEIRHIHLQDSLVRHEWLFYCYLVAIGFLFTGALVENGCSASIKRWIDSLYLFFGILSFLLTTALPGTLRRIQLARSAAEIERRREESGIHPR